jgi:hypothetical protein
MQLRGSGRREADLGHQHDGIASICQHLPHS